MRQERNGNGIVRVALVKSLSRGIHSDVFERPDSRLPRSPIPPAQGPGQPDFACVPQTYIRRARLKSLSPKVGR
jgi:hypothetical protein